MRADEEPAAVLSESQSHHIFVPDWSGFSTVRCHLDFHMYSLVNCEVCWILHFLGLTLPPLRLPCWICFWLALTLVLGLHPSWPVSQPQRITLFTKTHRVTMSRPQIGSVSNLYKMHDACMLASLIPPQRKCCHSQEFKTSTRIPLFSRKIQTNKQVFH